MDFDLENEKRAMRIRVATEQARAMADMTAAFVKFTGLSVHGMSFLDLFALSARLTKGAMTASGLLKYIPLETNSSEAATQFAKNCPDPERAANTLKYAEFLDVGVTLMKNFSPCDDELKNSPEPTSPMAKRWAAELDSPLHCLPLHALPAPAVATMQAEQPDEAQLRASRAKVMIPESEAAALLGMSPKALSNARRDKKIPRSLYFQSMEGGKVSYKTEALLNWANGKLLGKKSK